MKVGILSDTHDQIERTRTAVARLRAAGADVLIHCGDLTRGDVVEVCSELPFYFVFGNCDFDNATFLRRSASAAGVTCLDWGGEVSFGKTRIAVTHGHLGPQVDTLLAASPDVLLTGHSHLWMDRRDGAVRRINPGALHRASQFTVALLDTTTEELTFLDISC